jgi:Cd2+/Zn2+-exporting ATPase
MDGLADFLAESRGVEAILLNPDQRKVSIATLGNVDTAVLKVKLDEVIRALDARFGANGFHTAGAVTQPVSSAFALQVRPLPGDDVLIEKPSCPTAPSLWKWREFAWPEPEEIEKQSREEWQLLAMQAALCGAALATGWLAETFGLSRWIWVSLYVVSMVSGGWDAAQDAWEKIRKGQLDIHFLMLAVATGAMAVPLAHGPRELCSCFSSPPLARWNTMRCTGRIGKSMLSPKRRQKWRAWCCRMDALGSAR